MPIECSSNVQLEKADLYRPTREPCCQLEWCYAAYVAFCTCWSAGTPCDLLVSGIVCLATTSIVLVVVLYHSTGTDPGPV